MSTVRIRMKTNAAGPAGPLIAEREYEMSAADAKPLLEGNYAVPVRSAVKAETAAGNAGTERAVQPPAAAAPKPAGSKPPRK